MASSHGFGSAAPDENAHFGLAFAPAPARLCLNHAGRTHSPVHSSIGTPSGSGSPHAALGLLVRTRFQDLFHSPRRGAFHHSLTVLVRYRSLRVLCLGGWSPLLPTAFHGRRRTRDPRPRRAPGFAYGALTPSGRAFQSRSTRQIRRRGAPAKAPGGVAQPPRRVGCSPHARRGFRPRPRSLATTWGVVLPLLGVLRCFSSPGSPPRPIDSGAGAGVSPPAGCPIRVSSALRALNRSPRLFAVRRALPRPATPRHPPRTSNRLRFFSHRSSRPSPPRVARLHHTGGAGTRIHSEAPAGRTKARRLLRARRLLLNSPYAYLVNVRVGDSGLEPEASALSGQRSNQLS